MRKPKYAPLSQPINTCNYYARYKGIVRPKCNCVMCRELYVDNLGKRLSKED